MARGQEGNHDFVKNHSADCLSKFDTDYFAFDSEHCVACRVEVERRRRENAGELTTEDQQKLHDIFKL